MVDGRRAVVCGLSRDPAWRARTTSSRQEDASRAPDDIAAAAAVSRATVFSAVGGKPLLLKLAYDVAVVGDDAAVGELWAEVHSQRRIGAAHVVWR